EDISRLRETLRDGDIENAVRLVHRLADEARRDEPANIDSVRNAFFDLSAAVFGTARVTRGLTQLEDPERTYVWQEIHERASLDELRDLVCSSIRAFFSREQEGRGRESRAVMEIQRFIRENYASPGLSLQVIADHARLSRTYVSFLFKSVTGENINDYITRLRITHARELLLDPAVRTSEAASRVGYSDSSYFSTIFRKHVGMSPTEYRARAGGPP
ncbi:MAG TPA: helix-turn-helix domain-containing protein, partial [Spirochaetia bacterium]|nr:helix-turn-helix domain-containing protein [Spirochaetia bacterium]